MTIMMLAAHVSYQKVDGLNAEIAELRSVESSAQEVNAIIEIAQKELVATELALRGSEVAREEIEGRLENHVTDLKEARDRIEVNETALAAALDERKAAQERAVKAESEAKEQFGEFNELLKKIRARTDQSEERREAIESELAEQSKALEDYEAQLTKANKEYGILQQEHGAMLPYLKEVESNLHLWKGQADSAQGRAELLSEKMGTMASGHAAELETLGRKIVSLQSMVSDKSHTLATLRAKEFIIRQELIGLTDGQLRKVAVLFDRSGSMVLKEIKGRPVSEWPADLTKWKLAQREIRLWLEHLPMEEVVLIDFNSKVSVFPSSDILGRRRLLRIRDDNKEIISQNYRKLLSRFDSTKNIEGGTNTREALKAALNYDDLSLIILFTDGKPDTAEADPPELMARIQADLRSQSKQVPIYSVALGDYGEDQIQFLRSIANISGGSFIGK